MTRTFSLLLPLLLVAGCASNPDKPDPSQDVAGDGKAICTKEYRVGSNIPTTYCRTPESEAERKRGIEEMQNGKNRINKSPMGS